MSIAHEFESAFGAEGDVTGPSRGSSVGGVLGPDHGQHTVSPTLVGEAMVERAVSVIVVAWRVDEGQAAQILLGAAREAGIPVHLAAGQVMTALQAETGEGFVQDALTRALGAACPVDRTQSHDSLPAP